MKYILILTVIFKSQIYQGGAGGVSVSMQEFNTLEACENAGAYWKAKGAQNHFGPYFKDEALEQSYVCAPKGKQPN